MTVDIDVHLFPSDIVILLVEPLDSRTAATLRSPGTASLLLCPFVLGVLHLVAGLFVDYLTRRQNHHSQDQYRRH